MAMFRCDGDGGAKPMTFTGFSVTIRKDGTDDEARFQLGGGAVLPFPVDGYKKVNVNNLTLTCESGNGYTAMTAYLEASSDGSAWKTLATVAKADTASTISASKEVDVSNYKYFRIRLQLGTSWYNGKYTPSAVMTITSVTLS